MNHVSRTSLALLLSLATATFDARAQGVGIGTTAPNASAALDIVSGNKGVLLPRLSSTAAVSNPVAGLIVYQTTSPAGYYYYDGAAWQQLVPASSSSFVRNQTAQQASASFNVDGSGTVGGTLTAQNAIVTTALTGSGADLGGVVGVGVRADGGLNLGQSTTHNSLYLGYQAGQSNVGYYNQFSGYQSGYSNAGGSGNVFSGYQSGYSNTTSGGNVFSGYQAGYYNTTGGNNLFSGFQSGFNNTTGGNNTALGAGSGPASGSGAISNATAVGANVSLTNSNTVILGNGASVGIGTSAPTQLLDVVGTARATNAIVTTALTGSGADLGGVVGVGVRADGGLNLGQSTTHNSLYLGYQAGQSNVGYYNQFSGYQSGYSNAGGSGNVFSGYQSGYSNTTGGSSIFSGYQSGYSNTIGNRNTFNGAGSGYSNTMGNNNLFSGYQSGQYNTTGSGNTALGAGSGPANGNGDISNATAVGANVSLTQSNTVILGNGAKVGIGTSAPAYALDVAGTIRANNVSATSDARLKQHVRPLAQALASVLQLRGVRYEWNVLGVQRGGQAGAGQVGLIAQELEKVYPELVATDAQGYKSINYAQLAPVLIEALKELAARNAALEARAAQAEARAAQTQADHASLLTLQAQMARLLGEGSQTSTLPSH